MAMEGISIGSLYRINGADARMVEGRGATGLEHEAVQDRGFPGKLGREEFEGYAAAQCEIFSFVDYAHTATA